MEKIFLYSVVLAFATLNIETSATGEIVRGVSLKEQALYNPAQDFACFDGSKTIPFQSVNDDYCDCVDGSDEPGTSACPDGKFYCQNLGHKAIYLQSSRVNDGICDCCDGSDEYDSPVACFNQCEQQGKEEQVRLQQEQIEQNAGFEVRKGYIQTGADKKREKKARSETLDQLLEERRTKLEELKAIKEAAEAPEKEAKEKHDNAWNEQEAARKAEEEKQEMIQAFGVLDLDKNGWISFAELMAHPNLNTDMPENDAKDILGGEALVDAEGFEKIWISLKGRYLKDGRPKEQPAEGQTEGEDEAGTSETTSEASTNEEPVVPAPEESTPSDEVKKPDYDEATRVLIEAADTARQNFDEAEKEVRGLESEQTTLNDYLKIDFGSEDEFAALKGECFEFSDREYTYKICLFDRVTQRQKSGGSETDLGNWGHWEDGYRAMKYEGGQSCWNGPARSALVRMSCGQSNELLSVVEPSRCEYEMEFKTPALCSSADSATKPHTEL